MALYVSTKGFVADVSVKTGKSGKEYANCKLVFYSKSKDKDTKEYSKEDPKFVVHAVAFNDNLAYLRSLPGGRGFCDVQGKLYGVKVEKDGKTWTIVKKKDTKKE